MFCPNCGTKNEDDALFCGACGTPLREISGPENPGAQAENLYGRQMRQEQQMQGEQDLQNGQPPRQGESVYTDMPVQKKPAQHRKLPGLLFVVIAEAAAAILLIAGIVWINGKRFSPEKVAEDYWKAVMDCEWGKAYDFCSFPDSDLLTRQMYVNVNEGNDEKTDYESVRVIRASQGADIQADEGLELLLGNGESAKADKGTSESGDVRQYTVEYRVKGSSENSYTSLTLAKTKKRNFLFWDDWKVTSSESWVKDAQIIIPENAGITLNGVKVDASGAEVSDGLKTITIPYLFTGQYQMSVTEEGMEDYNQMLNVTSYGIEEPMVTLVPSKETVGEVAGKAGSDIEKIIGSALTGKTFDEIEDCFTENAVLENSVKENYEELVKGLAGDGKTSGIISLELSNMKFELSSQPSSGAIEFYLEMDRKETYHTYWGDPGENDYSMSAYLVYQKEGDEWKLAYLPISSYDF